MWGFDLDMENIKRSEGMSHALEGEDTWVVAEVRSSYAKPRDESCQLQTNMRSIFGKDCGGYA
jgi:hypothetical protein